MLISMHLHASPAAGLEPPCRAACNDTGGKI